MSIFRRAPSVYALLFAIIAITAAATWLIPAGDHSKLSYDKAGSAFVLKAGDAERRLPATQATLDALGVRTPLQNFTDGSASRPVPVPGSYRRIDPSPAGPLAILTAPVAGMVGAADVIFFVLVIGGFIALFNRTGAFDAGLAALAHRFRGREHWLIVIVTVLMAMGGASFGMAEETFAFYPLLAPVFLAAGYDRMVPLAVIYGGSQIGIVGSMTNPFSTIIASAIAGVNWTDGLVLRSFAWFVAVALLLAWTLRYTRIVRRDPARSLAPPDAAAPAMAELHDGPPPPLAGRTRLLLILFAATFATMIYGVSQLGWWFAEMTALFLGAAIVIGALQPAGDRIETFLKGARDLLGVGMVVGLARAVTVVLENSHVDATIIDWASNLLAGTSPGLFLIGAMGFFFVFCLAISSQSGMAVLTMPLLAPVAIGVGVSGSALVSAYLFGHSLMNLITPSGLILPSLAMLGIGYGAWLRFIGPVVAMMLVVCGAMLVFAA
ncbi:MAG: YfcC family protein [Sphingomonas sp.]|nr:YfcC family protein [Sphingomonas sp.]